MAGYAVSSSSKSFGFKVNAIPFELLAKAVPYELMLKHRQHIESLEALYYGQSGMLHTRVIDLCRAIKKRIQILPQ